MPLVVLAPSQDPLFEKMVSNIQETVSRGAKVLLISDRDGVNRLKNDVVWSIEMDDADTFVTPILYAIPMQLLAYYVAVAKGTDVDMPRNLAKSVTVE